MAERFVDPLEGELYVYVGSGREQVAVPVVISGDPNELYGACSPLNPWFSSLTFTPGQKLKLDYHGAEKTLKDYIDNGTLLAFLPRDLNIHRTPPICAREFIHRGMVYGYNNGVYEPTKSYVYQPAYAANDALALLLSDVVKWVLYHETNYPKDTMVYLTADYFQKGTFVDMQASPQITNHEIAQIRQRWKVPETEEFVYRIR